jgi:hypothetical protein
MTMDWSKLIVPAVGALAAALGFIDLETTGKLGFDRDLNLILTGLALAGGPVLTALVPAAAARVGALLRPAPTR